MFVVNELICCSEYLRSVPDVLESLISEKRLLQAAVLLVRSLKLINKQDMLDVGALSDLRSDLTSQETVFFIRPYDSCRLPLIVPRLDDTRHPG